MPGKLPQTMFLRFCRLIRMGELPFWDLLSPSSSDLLVFHLLWLHCALFMSVVVSRAD
jgi:hypothetical protein